MKKITYKTIYIIFLPIYILSYYPQKNVNQLGPAVWLAIADIFIRAKTFFRNRFKINKKVISVFMCVFPIKTQTPLDQFASNFDKWTFYKYLSDSFKARQAQQLFFF